MLVVAGFAAARLLVTSSVLFLFFRLGTAAAQDAAYVCLSFAVCWVCAACILLVGCLRVLSLCGHIRHALYHMPGSRRHCISLN
jgi:hypothetical protein